MLSTPSPWPMRSHSGRELGVEDCEDMVNRSASALASLLLTNRLVDVQAKPLTSGEYWPLVEQVGDPSGLLGLGADALVADLALPDVLAERAARLLDAGTALAIELEQLEQQGIGAVSPFDDAYPHRLRERLGNASPPVLYLAGPADLLRAPGIAIVGSRNVSDAGAEVAAEAARIVARNGDVLVSGGARGVDQLAMNAAFEAAGTVVGVLADALVKRLRQGDTRRAVTSGDACLITPYKPTAGFSVANAMARNKIVYALARTTLVVAADAERGGTWEGAVEALRKRYGEVAVWTGAGGGDGNEQLVRRGARPVDDLHAIIEHHDRSPATKTGQLRLSV